MQFLLIHDFRHALFTLRHHGKFVPEIIITGTIPKTIPQKRIANKFRERPDRVSVAAPQIDCPPPPLLIVVKKIGIIKRIPKREILGKCLLPVA